MAQIRPLACAVRAFTRSHHVVRYPSHGLRSISQTAVVCAKKKAQVSDPDDFFGDDAADSGDLFSSRMKALKPKATRSGSAVKAVKTKASHTPRPATTTASRSEGTSSGKRLSSDQRLARFNTLYQFLSERISKEPIKTPIQARTSAWTHLFGLATSAQQLQKVVRLFPLWRDTGRTWSPQIAENFVRRCEELKCPQLALQVFTDHPKYGLDLGNVSAARRLLHSLHVEHPLSDSITVSALYKIYNLPPVSSDLVSCAMLTSACLTNDTSDAEAIADGLLPSLQQLLARTPAKDMALPPRGDKALKARTESKEKAWLAMTLSKIEEVLARRGKDFTWLRQWRVESGHSQALA